MADHPQSNADEIMEVFGPIADDIDIFHNSVLVAVFIRPNYKLLPNGEKLHYADQTVDEDKWQGKVGLVLKKGRIAFQNDARNDFKGQDVNPGDWVMFRVNEAPAIKLGGLQCRLLEDIHVRGVIRNPEVIW